MDNSRSHYMDHTLNKSPSKTAYSFSRSQRFSNLENQYVSEMPNKFQYQIDFNKKTNILSPSKFRNSSREERNGRSVQKRKNWYNENMIKEKSPSKCKASPTKNKSKSPNKKVTFDQSTNRKSSPTKSKQILQRYQTNGQYYHPLGIQINKQGKYVVSNYQNVKTPSFGRLPRQPHISQYESNIGPGSYDIANKSPGKYYTSQNKNNLAYVFSKSPRKGPEDRTHDQNSGPGLYNTFSQFGNLN